MSSFIRPALAIGLALSLTLPLAAEEPSLGQLLAEHQDEAARTLIREQQAHSPFLALHLAQLEGVIRFRDGRLNEAVAIFRTILSAAPDFTPARLELAKALWQQGDTDAARHHFEQLQNGSRDPFVRDYAERALRAIEAARPYGFSISAALLPSSNFNRGSGQDTFDVGPWAFSIDEDSRAQSGVGASLGADAHYAFRLDEDDTVTASLSVDLQKYLETEAHDQFSLSPSLMWMHRFDNLTVSLGPTATYHWNAWVPYLLQYGVRGSVSKPLSEQDVVAASFAALRQDYVSLDYRDRYRLDATISLQHFFSPALNVVGKVGGTVERTERDHLNHNDLSLSATVNQQWEGGLITSFFAGYEHSQYLGDYPLAGAAREDHEVFMGATVSHRSLNLGGFTPELTYRYTRQFSNISFYDHDSHDVSLGLSKEF